MVETRDLFILFSVMLVLITFVSALGGSLSSLSGVRVASNMTTTTIQSILLPSTQNGAYREGFADPTKAEAEAETETEADPKKSVVRSDAAPATRPTPMPMSRRDTKSDDPSNKSTVAAEPAKKVVVKAVPNSSPPSATATAPPPAPPAAQRSKPQPAAAPSSPAMLEAFDQGADHFAHFSVV